jgi:outer membrane immunogenic protein
MKKLLLSGAAFVALAVGPAMAADLNRPVYKAPPTPPPVPVLNWTGWYVGLNAGGGWSNNDGIDNSVVSTSCNPAINSCAAAGHPLSNALAAAVPLNFDTGHNSGFIGGGQIGYNWETAPWVYGLEADFQGADLHGDASVTNTTTVTGFATTVTVTGAASQKIDFLGTLRGRLGWTTQSINPLLVYVTGGLAYGQVKTDVSFSQSTTACVACPSLSSSASSDEWRAGWTLGGGLEWMFAPHWSLKAEYLYYDLGHVTLNQVLPLQVGAPGAFFATAGISSEAHYRGNIARGGINYHF